ncbi:DUF3501 family protein [Rhabdothermincola sp.]|uniref:DUF3501 family protein n=1 Tax=Rhabdothermincola sp. TaxID=2820405 RepID=UPI002FE2CBE9
MTSQRKLTLDDIADLRAYEREREDFRARIIALKKRRRVHVGPFVTLVFENRDTIRFQIQEMARAERILSDEGIETELGIYNPLIPEPGHLSATLFIELTSEDELREWLPRLVGIEHSVVLRIGEGEGAEDVRCQVDPDHEKQLTREEVTASVHYVRFSLDSDQIERFAAGPVTVVIDHPAYTHEQRLTDETREELLTDLRP